MVKSITSPVNPLIKNIVLLSEKSKARKESGTFVVEGQREIGNWLFKVIPIENDCLESDHCKL